MSDNRGKPVTHSVRNRAAAEKQLTTEQLLREAQEFIEVQSESTKRTLHDESEVEAYKLSKRKEFQATVSGKGKSQIGRYIQFAQWEAKMKDYDASRRIFEDAIIIDPTNAELWKKYAEMEISHQSIQAARNIYFRATKTLPCSTRLWLLWLELEERVGNIDNARNIYYNMTHPADGVIFNPPESIWQNYVNFEIRCQNYNGALKVFEQFITKYPTPQTYTKYAFFVTKHGSQLTDTSMITIGHVDDEVLQLEDKSLYSLYSDNILEEYKKIYEKPQHAEAKLTARVVYERAVLELGLFTAIEQAKEYEEMLLEEQQQEQQILPYREKPRQTKHIQKPPQDLVESSFKLLFSWAQYETKHSLSRARRILNHVHEIAPTTRQEEVLQTMLDIEKQYGNSTTIDLVLIRLNRLKYKKLLGLVYDPQYQSSSSVLKNTRDYDTWLEWAKVEEDSAMYQAKQWYKLKQHQQQQDQSRAIPSLTSMTSTLRQTTSTTTPTFLATGSNDGKQTKQLIVIPPELAFLHDDVRSVYALAQDYPPLPSPSGSQSQGKDRVKSSPLPVSTNKADWKRFIYLFINHAFYEELIARDTEEARQVYKRCLDLIPHQYFTFSLVWIQAAKLEIRHGDLQRARRILGQGIGRVKDRIKLEQKRYGAPPQPILLSTSPRGRDNSPTATATADDPYTKPSNLKVLFEYIQLEQNLHDYERCRLLFQSFLEIIPASYDLWEQFTLLEANTGQIERARGLFRIALGIQSTTDTKAQASSVFIHETDEEKFWVLYAEFAEALEDGSVIDVFEHWLSRQPHNIDAYIRYAAFIAEQTKSNATIQSSSSRPRTMAQFTIEYARSILQRYHTRIKHAIAKGTEEEKALTQEMSNIALSINTLNPTQDAEAIDLYAQELYQVMQKALRVIESTIQLRAQRRDILNNIQLFEKTYGTSDSIAQATRNLPRKIQRTIQFVLPLEQLGEDGHPAVSNPSHVPPPPPPAMAAPGANAISFIDDTTISVLALTNRWQIIPHTFTDLLFPEDQKGISSLLARARQNRQQQQLQATTASAATTTAQNITPASQNPVNSGSAPDDGDEAALAPPVKRSNPTLEAQDHGDDHPLNQYVQLTTQASENNQDLTPPSLEEINS